jgi:hypothetical protein
MSRRSEPRRGRTRKRRPNAGSFRTGPDPRRHKFTASDCRVGWLVANILHPELREWLRMRLFVFYSAKERKERFHGQAQTAGRAGGGGDNEPPW